MSKKIKLEVLLLGILLFAFTGTNLAKGMEISGFVDVLYQNPQEENSSFRMGALEIDLAYEFSPRISFEGAVVVGGNEVSLGQTLVDFKLLNEKVGLQAGLIDMPFGIDYRVFATPERKLISPPLVTEKMMDGGWGDMGVNLYGSFPLLNYNLYLVNGMGEEEGSPVNQLEDNNEGKTLGGRVGITPRENLEIGFSYARGPWLPEDNSHNLSRLGVDFQFSLRNLSFKGEWVKGKEEREGPDTEAEGFYLQVLGKIKKKLYGVVRYGSWDPEGEEKIRRTTLCLGYNLLENLSLRSEYLLEEENNLFSLQGVVSF